MRPQGSLVCLGEPNQYIRPQEVLNKIFEEQYGVPLDALLSVKKEPMVVMFDFFGTEMDF